MSQSNSTVSEKTRRKILKHWKQEQDTSTETYEDSWADVSTQYFPWEHSRAISNTDVQTAVSYIESIVAKYPFQLRHQLALPLWDRFAEEYCDSGDVKKALMAI